MHAKIRSLYLLYFKSYAKAFCQSHRKTGQKVPNSIRVEVGGGVGVEGIKFLCPSRIYDVIEVFKQPSITVNAVIFTG